MSYFFAVQSFSLNIVLIVPRTTKTQLFFATLAIISMAREDMCAQTTQIGIFKERLTQASEQGSISLLPFFHNGGGIFFGLFLSEWQAQKANRARPPPHNAPTIRTVRYFVRREYTMNAIAVGYTIRFRKKKLQGSTKCIKIQHIFFINK